jgi:hypothetical protein
MPRLERYFVFVLILDMTSGQVCRMHVSFVFLFVMLRAEDNGNPAGTTAALLSVDVAGVCFFLS